MYSPLDAHHLFQRVHDFDQFRLRSHHRFDVLVGARNFVQHTNVLATFNTLGMLMQIIEGVLTLGRIARESTPCPV